MFEGWGMGSQINTRQVMGGFLYPQWVWFPHVSYTRMWPVQCSTCRELGFRNRGALLCQTTQSYCHQHPETGPSPPHPSRGQWQGMAGGEQCPPPRPTHPGVGSQPNSFLSTEATPDFAPFLWTLLFSHSTDNSDEQLPQQKVPTDLNLKVMVIVATPILDILQKWWQRSNTFFNRQELLHFVGFSFTHSEAEIVHRQQQRSCLIQNNQIQIIKENCEP